MKRIFKFINPLQRRAAAEYCLQAPEGTVARFSDADRTLDQNAAQWPILEAFAEQLQWPINGVMTYIEAEDWKAILSAAFENETMRVAAGLTGGMVLLPIRTSKLGKKRFSEYLDFLHYVAAERNVDLTKKRKGRAAP